ncbi:hypothetical protein CC78DRAFT_427262, partial [Lojkania enalia]
VPAQLAFDCLKTVPVDTEGDLKEIEELKELAQFQSTLSYLKDEIPWHHEGSIDVLAGLDEIAQGVRDGLYDSEYDVQLDLKLLFLSVHDFHFNWFPDILAIMPFAREGAQVISLSSDGVSLPDIYLLDDVNQAQNFSFDPSPITSINDQNATAYLADISKFADYRTADARYNTLFPNQAHRSIRKEALGPWAMQEVFDGPVTSFGFANGTSKDFDTVAIVRSSFDFTDVKDGQSFFDAFCRGPQESKSETPVVGVLPPVSLIGYPKPFIMQSSGAFHGHFLNDSGYGDVAVLAIPSFMPFIARGTEEINPAIECQKVLRAFFETIAKQGKTKLVIDLRGNGGGFIDLAYETFKQLFPNIEPFGGSRYRAHEAFEIYSARISEFASNATLAEEDPLLYGAIIAAAGTFDWRGILDADFQPFSSFREYYGPYVHNNDNFTSIRRYNFSNTINGYPSANTGPTTAFELTGYLSSPTPAQPFSLENIVILQDALCGSTCAIFSQLLREQGHVQSIVVGGRPVPAPMQAVGGTRGSQVLDMGSLVAMSAALLKYTSAIMGADVAQRINATAIGRLARTSQIQVRSMRRGQYQIMGRVNSLDALRQGDDGQTPLEFVFEAADCRVFETVESWMDPSVLWKMAVDAKWGDGECVPGSMGHETAI